MGLILRHFFVTHNKFQYCIALISPCFGTMESKFLLECYSRLSLSKSHQNEWPNVCFLICLATHSNYSHLWSHALILIFPLSWPFRSQKFPITFLKYSVTIESLASRSIPPRWISQDRLFDGLSLSLAID